MKKLILILILLSSQQVFAQLLGTGNSQIVAVVDAQQGFVTVLLPGGRIGTDPQLCFQNKSFFSCNIGGTIFTNNDILTLPANGKTLNGGNSIKIADTIRTTWLNKNGCDIIQDIYPVEFTKSGQIVYKWKINNHSGATVSVPSQYLQDVQVTETRVSHGGNQSTDGPTILTKWQYTDKWVQYPNSIYPGMPWFFIGFLNRLGSNASLDPGLNAMGYLDYGAPLFLTKPFRMTNGDWFDMARYIFGASPSWNVGGSVSAGNDNAILLEFPGVAVPDKKTVEIARTSYGTGEYEECVGQLFSLVFYPHHIVWTKDEPTPPGSYSPNPIHIEKFIVVPLPPQNVSGAANTKITLTVGSHLTLSDSLCKTFYGKSQTKPDAVGVFLAPGSVGYFDWWACADPVILCNAPIDTMKFTGTCSICPPAFLNDQGADECHQTIEIDCTETDTDPPEIIDTLIHQDSVSMNVHDWHASDKGLKSITWTPVSGTDTTKIFVLPVKPPILPCQGDNVNHLVTLIRRDSTIGGCFDFIFTDCIGRQIKKQVCMIAHPQKKAEYDPPYFSNLQRIDSLQQDIIVADDRYPDWGMKEIGISRNAGQDSLKYVLLVSPDIAPCFGDKNAHTIKIGQSDSTVGGCVNLYFEDCYGNRSYDTICFESHPVLHANVVDLKLLLSLEANHPNPFSHITTFNYTIPEYGIVKLYLYDELGKELSHIVEKPQAEGKYTISFDGSKLPSGSYIVRLESGGRVISRKVVVDR